MVDYYEILCVSLVMVYYEVVVDCLGDVCDYRFYCGVVW